MQTPTPADIKARYPAFEQTADGAIQLAIDDALPLFDVTRWGTLYAQGVAAYIGHTLVSDAAMAAGSSAAAGVLQSKRVGDVQFSYQSAADLKSHETYFMTTVYGQRYLQLRRMVGAGAIAI